MLPRSMSPASFQRSSSLGLSLLLTSLVSKRGQSLVVGCGTGGLALDVLGESHPTVWLSALPSMRGCSLSQRGLSPELNGDKAMRHHFLSTMSVSSSYSFISRSFISRTVDLPELVVSFSRAVLCLAFAALSPLFLSLCCQLLVDIATRLCGGGQQSFRQRLSSSAIRRARQALRRLRDAGCQRYVPLGFAHVSSRSRNQTLQRKRLPSPNGHYKPKSRWAKLRARPGWWLKARLSSRWTRRS